MVGTAGDSTDHAPLADPRVDRAALRGFYVHPAWERRRLAGRLLAHCEREAWRAGFHHLRLVASRTGAPFFESAGWVAEGPAPLALPSGAVLDAVYMPKRVGDDRQPESGRGHRRDERRRQPA